MVTFSFFFIFSGITPPVNGQGMIAAWPENKRKGKDVETSGCELHDRSSLSVST
jgi:hypothetical protein